MSFLARLFRREPESFEERRKRASVVRSAELGSPPFPRAVTGQEARAALERSRARRAAASGAG